MPLTNTLLIVGFDNIGDGITPTASFMPPAAYPLSNLSTTDLFERTRSSSLAEVYLQWDWGTPTLHNVLMLTGANASSSALYRIRDADDAGFTLGVVQSGAALSSAYDNSLGQNYSVYIAPWGRTIVYLYPTDVTKRYTRYHQSDATNPDGFQEWGIARIGRAWQPRSGFETYRTTSKLEGPAGAQVLYRGIEVTLHELAKDEAYDIESICHSSLNMTRMLVIREPLAKNTIPNDAWWCTFEGVAVKEPIVGTPYSAKKYRTVLSFREVGR